jgi:hypothetical protein
MTTRTDVHSPKNLVTEDYDYVWAGDNEHFFPLGMRESAEGLAFIQDINDGLKRSPLSDRGRYQCHHCGAHLRYVAILKHLPSGAYIAVGETCLENRFERATADFQALRKAAQLDREQQRIKNAARDFIANLGGELAIVLDRETFLEDVTSLEGYGLRTVSDIRSKLWQYGNLSDRQVAFVEKLLSEAKARNAAPAPVAETKVDAPTGRMVFEGVVVSRKWVEGDYGSTCKIVLKCDDQERGGIWLVYVTEPNSITTEKGDVVRMTATLTRSDRDRSFAFGKRPSKAEILRHGAVVANVELPDSLA